MKTRACLKYFVNGCLGKQFFASNLPQVPLNLIFLTNFVPLRSLTLCQSKFRATKLQRSTKICVTL